MYFVWSYGYGVSGGRCQAEGDRDVDPVVVEVLGIAVRELEA